MATIKDVARLAGVSVATVSRVINNSPKASEASRQSVGAAMETLNYHPNANARALAQQSTETVGLVVGDVSDPFFGAMVKAVEQVAYRTGNFLLIGNGYHNVQKERQAIEQLIRHRCAALVVHAKMIPDEELAGLMKQIPGMVLINRILPGYETRCVALDDRYGAWLATRHLIQQGHTRIGYLCSNHDISDAEDRLQGYYAALEESGLPCNDRLVTFAEPDEEVFRCLKIAKQCAAVGNIYCAAMNGANEEAVAAFLRDEIGICAIPALIEAALDRAQTVYQPQLSDILEADRLAREVVREKLN